MSSLSIHPNAPARQTQAFAVQGGPRDSSALLKIPAQHIPPQHTGSERAWSDESTGLGIERRLSSALVDGDTCLAEALVGLTWRESGLAAAHALVAGCLAEAGRDWAGHGTEMLTVKAMTATARAVLERLRAATPSPTRAGVVVLAAPAGDSHTLTLTALAHHVEQSGRTALIVDDLPLPELTALAAWPSTLAVVFSAHLPWRAGPSAKVIGALKAARPDLLVVVGGPGAQGKGSRALGVVTDDVAEMLEALEGRDAVLTMREREVMLAVADGLTNNEIAEQLGLSSSTVKTHLDRVFLKTGTVHRAAAVAHALRQGWIS